jgi:hypothetical protein
LVQSGCDQVESKSTQPYLLTRIGISRTCGKHRIARRKTTYTAAGEYRCRHDMRFLVYMIGFLILIGGLGWAAITAGAPTLYVEIGAMILLGLGIITGVTRTRSRTGSDVTVVRDDERL